MTYFIGGADCLPPTECSASNKSGGKPDLESAFAEMSSNRANDARLRF